ncbi:MAG TPA: transcriptional regulator [Armatimonadetes bacterium]|nr:transcriptional regulator [Armatimonadota bacterium]
MSLPLENGEGKMQALVERMRQSSVLRTREIEGLGISREQLGRLHRRGVVQRVSRGLYSLPDGVASTNHTLAEAAKRVPHGVVCLLSALRFHGFTTQAPSEAWLAIDVKARQPAEAELPLRIVRFSGDALAAGIEKHEVDGVAVRVYSPGKTVADCFKFRNKIGLDVALEALREGWRERRFSMDELWRYAKVCRVANVMRPYLEALSL